jgi:hypothetical protein
MSLRTEAIHAYESTMRGETLMAAAARKRASEQVTAQMMHWRSAMGFPGLGMPKTELVPTYYLGLNDEVECDMTFYFAVDDVDFRGEFKGSRLNVYLGDSRERIENLIGLGRVLTLNP